MQLPIYTDELTDFFDVPWAELEAAIATNRLKQSLCCQYRPSSSFRQCSIYDVLEFALCSGHFNIVLSNEAAESMIFALSSIDQTDKFLSAKLAWEQADLVAGEIHDYELKFCQARLLELSYRLILARNRLIFYCKSD